jgi:DNA helicase-2/ATP-dependent DNA helicase PcrA
MNICLNPDDWCPIDDLELEHPGATEVVKSTRNCFVIAGPGTGKTELLAQRASYLLQTGGCPAPRRILALSYKRDARRAISVRVRKRVGAELSSRFVSMTYHGFAKSLVDRFRMALPSDYRPNSDYEILLTRNQFHQKLEEMGQIPRLASDWVTEVFSFSIQSLPIQENNPGERMKGRIWRAMLGEDGQSRSYMNFPMISVLAEYLVRSNPRIRRALVMTYSHVFLDEFQDTTRAQYRLVRTCFDADECVLTAVGDHKQRIMLWAGADRKVFERFERDFDAIEKNLSVNHRSASELLSIQESLARRITGPVFKPVPGAASDGEKGVCEIWVFDDSVQEARTVARSIEGWIQKGKLEPRDICVLVRIQPDVYGNQLISELSQRKEVDVLARNEVQYQDVLAEDCSRILLDVILSAFGHGDSESCDETMRLVNLVRGADPSSRDRDEFLRIEADFGGFLDRLKTCFDAVDREEELEDCLWRILDYLHPDLLKNVFPQYRRGDYLEEQITILSQLLWQERKQRDDWVDAIRSLEGDYSVPVMTIHKSKGLEYHTVVFLGFEDSAFFRFGAQEQEETCALFVALSRAKRRVVLTFSRYRLDSDTDEYTKRCLKDVRPLYEALKQSGGLIVKDFRTETNHQES